MEVLLVLLFSFLAKNREQEECNFDDLAHDCLFKLVLLICLVCLATCLI